MELCIILDGNGHFKASDIRAREETIGLLKDIDDGDAWDNQAGEYIDDESPLFTLRETDWKSFLHNFTCRGRMEIVEI